MDTSRQRQPQQHPEFLSNMSTLAVPDSTWYAANFLLGAGMVVIQPSTGKILVIQHRNDWFLPKGRKDRGESLEQTALREAYEESGYRVQFLPVYSDSKAPAAPGSRAYEERDTEPIFVTTVKYGFRRRKNRPEEIRNKGEYLSFYYVGQIAEDAVHEENTGMPNEKDYTSHLLSPAEAMQKLNGSVEAYIVRVAWDLWLETCKIEMEKKVANKRAERALLIKGAHQFDDPVASTSRSM